MLCHRDHKSVLCRRSVYTASFLWAIRRGRVVWVTQLTERSGRRKGPAGSERAREEGRRRAGASRGTARAHACESPASSASSQRRRPVRKRVHREHRLLLRQLSSSCAQAFGADHCPQRCPSLEVGFISGHRELLVTMALRRSACLGNPLRFPVFVSVVWSGRPWPCGLAGLGASLSCEPHPLVATGGFGVGAPGTSQLLSRGSPHADTTKPPCRDTWHLCPCAAFRQFRGCTAGQDPGLKASPKAPLFTLSPPFDCVEVSAVCWGEGAGVDLEQNWVLPAF